MKLAQVTSIVGAFKLNCYGAGEVNTGYIHELHTLLILHVLNLLQRLEQPTLLFANQLVYCIDITCAIIMCIHGYTRPTLITINSQRSNK